MVEVTNECVQCGLPCMGDACRYRHVERHYCNKCGNELYDENYMTEDGHDEYCEECYFELYGTNINGEVMCADCGEWVNADNTIIENGKHYCKECYEAIYEMKQQEVSKIKMLYNKK